MQEELPAYEDFCDGVPARQDGRSDAAMTREKRMLGH
jgi:hypothetical protein